MVSRPRVSTARTRAVVTPGGTSTGTMALPRSSAVTGPKNRPAISTVTAAPGDVSVGSDPLPTRRRVTAARAGAPAASAAAMIATAGARRSPGE